jgi:hypothetical protein
VSAYLCLKCLFSHNVFSIFIFQQFELFKENKKIFKSKMIQNDTHVVAIEYRI